MICPRCSVAEISPATNTCELCGYVPGSSVAVEIEHADATDNLARVELSAQFKIDVLLGQGTASTVYLARDLETSRHAILKVLMRYEGRAPDADERFREAVLAAQSLDHPHLVPVLRYGMTDSLFWYTMEPVRGRPLRELLRVRGPLDLKACLRICAQIGSALDYMHRRNMVHGRLTPENVLIDPDGWAHVCDAMVPRSIEPRIIRPSAADATRASRASSDQPKPSLPRILIPGEARTSDPAFAGPSVRPAWLAPEDFASGQGGPAADQYALGALVYECLAGHAPPTGIPEPATTLDAARPGLPAHVAFAVRRAMEASPMARFPSVLDFVTVLESGIVPMAAARPTGRSSQVILTDPGWKPPPRAPLRLVKMGLAAVALVALIWGTVTVVNRVRQPKWYGPRPGAPGLAAPARQTATPDSQPATGAPQGPAQAASAPASPGAQASPPPASPSPVASQRSAAVPTTTTTSTRRTDRTPGRTSSATQPAPTPTAPTATTPAPAAAAAGAAKLFVNSSPWGQVFVDGTSMGNTPKANLPLTTGMHRIRVIREGYDPFERTITVVVGETVRLTDIVLVEHKP